MSPRIVERIRKVRMEYRPIIKMLRSRLELAAIRQIKEATNPQVP